MLETIFKSSIPLKNGIVYTKVPRGLIISIDEKFFFNDDDARIKESSLHVLDILIYILHELPNYCVVEVHTENNNSGSTHYVENWELSLARSSNIADYMLTYGKLPADRLFALGFGEYMPFKDNVASSKGMDSRVDFVILEYEAKR